jgi:hypothetical protein
MKTPLQQGESIIKEGAANLQKGIEIAGGKLRLTNQRLVFEAHRVNVKGGVTDLPLSRVVSCSPWWTLFLGLIPLFPNSLAVQLEDGKEHRFVLFDRQAWSSAIAAQLRR